MNDFFVVFLKNNKVVINYEVYELYLREVNISYDVIIERKSIIRYNLLQYDDDSTRVSRWQTKCPENMRQYKKKLSNGKSDTNTT